MATKFKDPDLDRARENVRSFEKKADQVQRSDGFAVDKNGEPKLTDPRGDRPSGGMERDAGQAARQSLSGGPRINSTPGLGPPGSDSHITGQVGGKDNKGPSKAEWKDKGAPAKKQEAMLRPTKLILPTVRPKRIANEHGATSFHFSHEAISKTNQNKTTNRGTKNRKGAAKDHVKYLERDGAVANANADDMDKIEKELDDIARNDPELAARLGLEPKLGEGGNDPDSDDVAKALGVGGLASVYIEREEALAHNDNGTAVLFTNISKDPKERRDFWHEVEKQESDPSDDRMRILIKGNEEFWNKIAQEEDCPKILKQAIEAADPSQEVVVRTGDNEDVRKLMKRHGWRSREKRPEDETDEQKDAREEREAKTSFGARFEDGRGGRVQFRVVGELPYDVDHAARVRILKDFSKEFEEKGLPYIAVMHAPDHTNDDRNWHFHLVYHDRPVKRFTGRAEDHLWELPDDAGSKKARQHEILQSTIGSPELEKHAGKWDFMVPWQYKKADRHTKTTFPFAQQKNREVTRRPYIPALRKLLSELTNRELEKAKIERRLDPRKYSEMGIHKAPDVHLGTQASRLESVGIPTEAGLANEENQWNYIRENLENLRVKNEMEIDRKLKSWTNGLNAGDVTDAEREKAEKEMLRWEQEARRAAEHRSIALNLQEHYDRLQSRANKLAKMADKHLAAIEGKRATDRQIANHAQYENKKREAKIHLLGLKLFMADEVGQIVLSENAAAKSEEKAKGFENTINGIVSKGASLRKEKEGSSSAEKDPKKDRAAAQPAGAQPAVSGLSKKDVDNYIKRLVERNARMIDKNGTIIPAKPTAKDIEVIASNGYEQTQARLTRMKVTQDGMIAELATAIERNPRVVISRAGKAADETDAPHSKRYRLGTKNRRHQQTFGMFADEPEITKAIDKAIAKLEIEARARKTGRNAPDKNEQAQAPTPSAKTDTVRPVIDSAKPEKAPPPKAKDEQQSRIAEVLDLSVLKHLRPAAVKTDGRLELTFSRQDVALYRVPANLVIEDDRSIARMEGIMAKNDRAVKRLVAYLSKKPSSVREPTEADPALLAKSAPKELRQISADYARDPQVRRAIEDAAVKARLEALDPRNQKIEPKEVAPAPSANKVPETPVAVENEIKPADKSAKVADNDKPITPATENVVQPEMIAKPEDVAQPGAFRIDEKGRLVRNVEPTEVKDYGVRKVSGKDDAAKAPDKAKENAKDGEGKRRVILDDSQMDLLGERTYERAVTRKLEKGINPKLDSWIEADKNKDKEARQKAAAIIRGDRHLLSIVDEMNPQVRAMLQRDWDGIDDRNRRSDRTIEDRNKNR